MTSTAPKAKRRAIDLSELYLPLLVFTVVAAVFSTATMNLFVAWDDHVAIVANPYIDGLSWGNLRWMFTTTLLGPYQPLSWMSLAIDREIWGLDPAGFHLTSALIHALNAAIFFAFCRKLLAMGASSATEGNDGAIVVGALVASLAHMLHPLRVESVAWATERRDVLSGFFFICSLIVYLDRARGDGRPATDERGIVRSQFPALILFLFALLSKTTVMSLPLVLVILDVYPLRRLPADPRRWLDGRARRVLAEKLPFVALAIAFAAIALTGQVDARAVRSIAEAGWTSRFASAFHGVFTYFWMTFVPTKLSPLYEVPSDVASLRLFILRGAAFFGVVSFLVWRFRSRAPGLLAAWLSYLALVAPVSGFVRIGTQIAADRYTYLACMPFSILAGAFVSSAWQGRSRPLGNSTLRWNRLLAFGAVVVALGVLTLSSMRQIRVWRDSASLWRQALDVDPNSPIAHYGLGSALATEGLAEEAIAHYREAVRLDPLYADARNNLGTLLAETGRAEEAREQFRAIESKYPLNPLVHYHLGLVAMRLGDTDEAIARYRRALELQPGHRESRINLTAALFVTGDADAARACATEGLALSPGDTTLQRLLGSTTTPIE